MNPPQTATPRFSELGIALNLLAVLEKAQFVTPTPIQHQVIPTALEGKRYCWHCPNRHRQTLAFGVPMLQRLGLYKGQGLILLPTRELALQVNEVLEKLADPLGCV